MLELKFEFGEDLVCSNSFHGETVKFDFVFASVSYPDPYFSFAGEDPYVFIKQFGTYSVSCPKRSRTHKKQTEVLSPIYIHKRSVPL